MKDVPFEILGEIFLYLHPKDRVDCMLVCQHWKQVIETFALYHTLVIRSQTSFDKLNSMVKENPAIGERTKNLIVGSFIKVGDFDLNEFLLSFRSIRKLQCTTSNYQPPVIEDNILYPWNKHIEYIYENSEELITYHLLLSSTCPNLTTIDIGYFDARIFSLLANAPALKSLILRNNCMTINDLDTIHKNAPCLESFTGSRIWLEDSELSQNVNPAISVTEFYFDDNSFDKMETAKNLLTYATKKYPNLSKLVCTSTLMNSSHGSTEKQTDFDWLPLLQNVGPQLKKFGLCSFGWVDNIFEILDRFDCQIEYLKIQALKHVEFMKIIKSNQIFYIQTLSVDAIDFETFDWLNDLRTLKNLELSRASHNKRRISIDLNMILNNSPPTLRSLSLHDCRLFACPESTASSNIESLSFDLITIPKGIDAFISQCFPKLSNLKLTRCDVIGGVFNLEKMDLLNFSYKTRYIMKGIANILIVTSANNERRWYEIRAVDGAIVFPSDILQHAFYSSVKSRPQNETDTETLFTLLCNSLNTCILI